MTLRKRISQSFSALVSALLWTLSLAGLLGAEPTRAAADDISPEVLDRIQRECLRAYPTDMLRTMTGGAHDTIPTEVEEDPESQEEFLEAVLELDKGRFYPFLLEDLLEAFALYVKPGTRFLDLGSGDGRVVFLANALGADATGIEYNPQIFEISQRAAGSLEDLLDRQRLHLVQGDFFESSWSGYDVIFYFDLSSFEHHRLRKKIAQELDPGARLLVGHQRAVFPGLALETTVDDLHVYRQPGAVMHDPTFRARCEKEIHDLHQFFEDWFNGVLAPSEENLARVADVLAPGFVLIGPDGRATYREPLIRRLRRAHGSWREPGSDSPGTRRIRIEGFQTRLIEGPTAIAVYEEWHENGDEHKGRISTAFFRLEHGLPNEVRWYHLQETWLPK